MESVVPGEQTLTERVSWSRRARIGRATRHIQRFQGHARQGFYGAVVLATLSCLPGCASPLYLFGQQQPSIISAPQRQSAAPQVNDRRRHAPPQASAQRANAPSAATEHLAENIRQSGDNGALPFLIVDKVAASISAYDANGRLLGVTPALLGAARGDHSVPGIGERPIGKILPHERTTPAGRFIAETGKNAQGEDIVWIDYDAAVSLHRVRATNPAERRLQRLASPTPHDNRISYGCINIPVRYFDDIVKPLMKGGKAVAYVLPETKGTEDVFSFVRVNSNQTGKNDQNGNRAKRPG